MMGLAMPASRSLIALLVGTVVFFALWMVALKPSSSSNGGKQGLGSFQSAINKAHQAVATSNASNAASGNENPSSSATATSSSHPATTSTATPAHSSKAATKPSVSSTQAAKNALARELSTVKWAVSKHRVLALLFYNPAAADDQAVKKELGSVSTHKGQVVKLAIPIDQAASFTTVTQQVPINLSPTVVVISRAGDANELVGYTDPFVINQNVSDALAAG